MTKIEIQFLIACWVAMKKMYSFNFLLLYKNVFI